jgi:hypothetical protein
VGVDAVINQHLLELPVVRAGALGLRRVRREQGAACRCRAEPSTLPRGSA